MLTTNAIQAVITAETLSKLHQMFVWSTIPLASACTIAWLASYLYEIPRATAGGSGWKRLLGRLAGISLQGVSAITGLASLLILLVIAASTISVNRMGKASAQAVMDILSRPSAEIRSMTVAEDGSLKATIGYPRELEDVRVDVLGAPRTATKTVRESKWVTLDERTLNFLAAQDVKFAAQLAAETTVAKNE